MVLPQDVRSVKKLLDLKETDMGQDINKKKVAHGEDFIMYLSKLKGDELCALSRFLSVHLLTDEVDPETKTAIPRSGADIIDDLILRYGEMSRTDRRWLIKYLKKTTQGR